MKTIVRIDTPNGLKKNQELNDLADKIENLYKSSKHLKFGFEVGFDGLWEYIIENTKTDRAMVLKSNKKGFQMAFIYLKSFSTQETHSVAGTIPNKQLLEFTKKIISEISK